MSNQVVGVTGANGFIASHLIRRLTHQEGVEVLSCPRKAFSDADALAEFVGRCDVVVHLAAVNRGADEDVGGINARLIDRLVAAAEESGTNPHIIFSSSTQIKLQRMATCSGFNSTPMLAASKTPRPW